jgi:hypothetical protein
MCAAAIVTFLSFCLVPVASAQETPTCNGLISASSSLSFDDDGAHQRWYRRFWAGQCSGLFWCTPGTPNWNAGIANLIRKHALKERPQLIRRLCVLGRRMGFEWAKDNSIRTIHTADLEVWIPELDGAAEIEPALQKLERLVAARLKQ